MPLRLFRVIVPLAIAAGLACWWWLPQETAEDKAYYASLLCAVSDSDPSQLAQAMQQVVENGNADYALKKITFNPALAGKAAAAWQALPPAQQQALSADSDRCRQRILAAL